MLWGYSSVEAWIWGVFSGAINKNQKIFLVSIFLPGVYYYLKITKKKKIVKKYKIESGMSCWSGGYKKNGAPILSWLQAFSKSEKKIRDY